MELNHAQKIILAVSIVFFILGSLFVGLYLSSCLFVVKRLRFADYLMLLAWVMFPRLDRFDALLTAPLATAIRFGVGSFCLCGNWKGLGTSYKRYQATGWNASEQGGICICGFLRELPMAPGLHSHIDLIFLTGFGVYFCEKFNFDILARSIAWPETYPFRELYGAFGGRCCGHSLDTETNISLPSIFRRI